MQEAAGGNGATEGWHAIEREGESPSWTDFDGERSYDPTISSHDWILATFLASLFPSSRPFTPTSVCRAFSIRRTFNPAVAILFFFHLRLPLSLFPYPENDTLRHLFDISLHTYFSLFLGFFSSVS